jgi:hypothetical protein
MLHSEIATTASARDEVQSVKDPYALKVRLIPQQDPSFELDPRPFSPDLNTATTRLEPDIVTRAVLGVHCADTNSCGSSRQPQFLATHTRELLQGGTPSRPARNNISIRRRLAGGCSTERTAFSFHAKGLGL